MPGKEGEILAILGTVMVAYGTIGYMVADLPTFGFLPSNADLFGLGHGSADVLIPPGGANVFGRNGAGYKLPDLAISIGGVLMVVGGLRMHSRGGTLLAILGFLALLGDTWEVWID
jgi:hypothetical protein